MEVEDDMAGAAAKSASGFGRLFIQGIRYEVFSFLWSVHSSLPINLGAVTACGRFVLMQARDFSFTALNCNFFCNFFCLF
jgi:hypothetical protein